MSRLCLRQRVFQPVDLASDPVEGLPVELQMAVSAPGQDMFRFKDKQRLVAGRSLKVAERQQFRRVHEIHERKIGDRLVGVGRAGTDQENVAGRNPAIPGRSHVHAGAGNHDHQLEKIMLVHAAAPAVIVADDPQRKAVRPERAPGSTRNFRTGSRSGNRFMFGAIHLPIHSHAHFRKPFVFAV